VGLPSRRFLITDWPLFKKLDRAQCSWLTIRENTGSEGRRGLEQCKCSGAVVFSHALFLILGIHPRGRLREGIEGYWDEIEARANGAGDLISWMMRGTGKGG